MSYSLQYNITLKFKNNYLCVKEYITYTYKITYKKI